MNNSAQLRLLDLITALEREIDPGENAQNQIMEITNIIAGLTDWFYNNPDLDIADHPDYARLLGQPCAKCFGRLERRDNDKLYCAQCELLQEPT